ncbi:MAG TPA: phosphopantetheine-binding protein [Oligoflexus sp.]|uniref:phosphopantetheine-binding protein n=1 Tax=Oligoflexus sp. TaxID=1971216 RepID=UPI002D678163|nr:phosphopantetheine-binding protein [Oligoflexus sp.]HYX36052.1 phosphopantetheine-binding protein [Oligoflexus sp.]
MPVQKSVEEIKSEIKQLLLEVSNLPGMTPDRIDDQLSLFQDGLGLDSIDILELVVALDKRYAIKVRNDEIGRNVLRNVSTIAQAIHHSQLQTAN